MSQLKFIFFLIVAFLLTVFAILNPNPVVMNFFGWKTPGISLIVIVFGSIILGGAMLVVAGLKDRQKSKSDIRTLETENQELRKKVVKLEFQVRELEETIEKTSR